MASKRNNRKKRKRKELRRALEANNGRTASQIKEPVEHEHRQGDDRHDP